MKEQFTYKKRLGWLNSNNTPAIKGPYAGEIFKFHTMGGVPVILPDQEEGQYETEPIPEGYAVHRFYPDNFVRR
jgi:hypothetical protein